ncbi:MAG: anion transporter [Clostridia bacterium]|nr:anion transporter [Clostridia bacterium]
MMQKIHEVFKKEPVFGISLLLAVATQVFVPVNPGVIDWKVIITHFNLMAVIVALEKYKVLDNISRGLIGRFDNLRYLSMGLIILTGVSAMLVTNDVALLTLIPVTLMIGKRCNFNPAWLVILQTLAANLGSSLTPMGNPQNLFLYEYYHLGAWEFIKLLFPLVLAGLIFSLVLAFKVPQIPITYRDEEQKDITSSKRSIFYLVFFMVTILSIFRLIDYRLMFVCTLLVIFILDRDLFLKIDYYLLGTFGAFFVFVGNLTQIFNDINNVINMLMAGNGHTFFLGVVFSQLISNVPAAILLANFSGQYQELLWGVNIGGMGTLVASLASLISYKLYTKDYSAKDYLIKFHIVNFAGLIFFSSISGLLFLK